MSQRRPEPSSPQHQFFIEFRHVGGGCSAVAWVSVALAVLGILATIVGTWITVALAKGWL
jgi:hypothetical protein